MSSQIQITGETKVKSLTGVLVGTSGVVSSLNIDGSLGIPQLDVNGKILVSQLPNSVMEYKGTWDASTNTPTLVNGTGNQGDVYLCSVAGTVNFGAGAIAFVVSDQVIYSGSIWQKASGTNGTVTSVGLSTNAGAITIGSSPITTSGTITANFNGTNLQYVNGAGNLTTFPILTGYVTAVSGTAPVVSSGGTTPAISMAAATGSVDGYLSATDFAIFNAKQSALTFSSPLVNTSGTISIPAATTSVNGYLASADFTTFNAKQNAITLTTTGTSGASTLVGATLNIPNYGSALTGYVPYTGATQDVDLDTFKLNAQSIHAKGTGGNGHLGLKHQSASATASANEVSLFADSLGNLSWLNGNLYLSKFIISGNTAARSYTFPNANGTVALTSDISYPVTSVFGRTGAVVATSGDYTTAQVTESGNLYFTDSRARLALSFVAGSGAYNSTTGVITIPTNNNQITNGSNYITLTSLSAGVGISYNNTTGVITNSAPDQTVALTASTGISVTGTYPNFTITNTSPSSGGTVTSVAALTIGTSGTDLSSSVATSTTTPVITLNVPTASATNRGALSSADWTTFNNKQSALTNPVLASGTWTSGYLPKINGTYTIGNSLVYDNATSVFINATTAPAFGSPKFFVKMATANSYEGILVASSSNNNAIAIAHTGTLGLITTNYGTSGTNTNLGFGTGGATQMTLDTSGNLGLGVTPSAWGAFRAFEIGYLGNGLFATGQNDINILSNVYYNGGYKYAGTGKANLLEMYNGDYYFNTAPSGTAGNAITFTQAMTLLANGDLVVGATTSLSGGAYKNIQVDGISSALGAFFTANGATGSQAQFRGYINSSFKGSLFYTSTQGCFSTNALPIGFSLNSGGSNDMTLFTTGNFAINTTTDSGYKLDVNGTGRFTGNVGVRMVPDSSYSLSVAGETLIQGGGLGPNYATLILLDVSSGGSQWAILQGFPALGDFTIRESGVANHLVIKKTTGNVLIGNDTNPYLEIANGGSTNVASGIKWMVGSGRTYYGAIELATPSASNSYLSFSTMLSGTVAERLRIASTGAATFSSSVTTGDYIRLPLDTYLQSSDGSGGWIELIKGSGINTVVNNNKNGAIIFNQSSGGGEKMRITSTGNVGIGTSSPSSILDVQQSSTTNVDISFMNTYGATSSTAQTVDIVSKLVGSGLTGQVGSMIRTGKEGDYSSGGARDAYMSFSTAENDNLAERMRITSGGALCLGVTSAYGTNLLNVNGGIYATSSIAAVVAADIDMLAFVNTGATYSKACVVASMTATGGTGSYFFYGQQSTSTAAIKIFSNGNIQNTNNSYGAISDARLKENIKDATPKLDDLMKVKVRNYNLKGESNKQLGVISQELEAIFPNMIEESTNMGENMKIKGVKYSVFVPMLIKAVQEQQQQINELKQLINK